MEVNGVWLPIVTPFVEGHVDFGSYERLVSYYLGKGINGIIPLGTTGESPVISDEESYKIIKKTVDIVEVKLPVFAGCGGNNTALVISKLEKMTSLGVDGILSACPYYNKPGQEGLFRHFVAIAEATDLKIIIYNIPHRTGVNMTNETIFRLAKIDNIIGIKDSCGDISQSLDLIARKPDNFSVMTGEDHLFFNNLAHGGDGGILAAAHLETTLFSNIFHRMTDNDLNGARGLWRNIEPVIPLLFEEANPGPVKFWLQREGLIRSGEMRLPMTDISDELKDKIDDFRSRSNEGI